jgi:GT2 family glycosyltransferase
MVHRSWLAILVHADAFRSDPFGYVQALLWRLRGLRVRSRNRLAALMGRSPRAYALWIARVEPKIRAAFLGHEGAAVPLIVPIVAGGSPVEIDVTLQSIRGASSVARPVVVRGSAPPAAADIEKAAPSSSSPAAEGTWICLLGAGDQLAPGALDIYASAAARWPDRWVIYADDDLVSGGKRRAPHFKSSWNPELFDHHDFVTASAILRVTADMLADLPDDDWAKALTDRAIARRQPVHLAAVLHHRASRPQPTVPAKPQPVSAERLPPVSIVIPTRNRRSLLQTCVEGVLRTVYPSIELIIVDNDSDEPEALTYLEDLSRGVTVLKVPGPFNFSALNNAAVEHAQGELLCFLNNDVEITDPDWLALLARQAVRPEIGAVGGRLLYPDGTVQHAGVVTSVGGGAAHAHRFQRGDDAGYFLRDRLPQRVSAVTAACLVVAREKFLAVGGFNEKDFPVAFNDVDLCLKLNGRGWQSFYEPRATLIHHESKSRGSDRAKENRARFAAELSALKRHWGTDRVRDPYHHPQLSPFSEQFYIAL